MSEPRIGAEHVLDALDQLAEVFNEQRAEYALIGGLGVAMRGTVRATQDVDFLVQIPQLHLPGVLEALANAGCQIDINEAIRVWSRDHLLNFSCGSVRVDWLKPVLPAFTHVLERARWEQINSRAVRVADAEGLLLLKLIAFRPRDQEDIKGILATNSGHLDLDWVRREWSQLAGDSDSKTKQFEELVSNYYGPPKSIQQ